MREAESSTEVKLPTYDYDNSLAGKEGMKDAVRGYNQTRIDAYLSDWHIRGLEIYATKKAARRAFVFITTDRERDLAMRMKLNKLVFDNLSTSEDLSFVDTSENWDFHYVNISTGKPIEPVQEMRYKLRYIMVREGEKWFVSKLEEREKAKIGRYSPPRWSIN